MRRSRFSVEEIMQILKEGEISASTVLSICKEYDISNVTNCLWRTKYNESTISLGRGQNMNSYKKGNLTRTDTLDHLWISLGMNALTSIYSEISMKQGQS